VTRLVVDSSVVIKWSVPEVHSEDALRYLDPDEGTARRMFWRNGRWHDAELFAVLADD
jgi:predicted nucleic acid-binding protein